MAIEVAYSGAGQSHGMTHTMQGSVGKNSPPVPQGRAFGSILRVLADQSAGISKAGTDQHDAAKMFNEDGLFGTCVFSPEPQKNLQDSSLKKPPKAFSQKSINGPPVGDASLLSEMQNENTQDGLAGMRSAGNVPTSSDVLTANVKVECSRFASENTRFILASPDGETNGVTISVDQSGKRQNQLLSTDYDPQKIYAQRARLDTTLPSMLSARPGSASPPVPVQIAVSDLEKGVTVVARITHLSAEQKKKLLPALAALLAQYGMAQAEFVLNGEALHGPFPLGE